MANTTVTFRTDNELKEQASILFDSLGMNLSVALNLFMKQAVARQAFPCSLDLCVSEDCTATYPADFFSLAGSGNGLGFDGEPEELPMDMEDIVL